MGFFTCEVDVSQGPLCMTTTKLRLLPLNLCIQWSLHGGCGDCIGTKKLVEVEGDPYSPPSDKLVKSSTDELIMEVLKELKISYPNEIAAQTGFSQQTVLARLAYLRVHGVVERVVLGRSPPDDLLRRLSQLWEVGLKGPRLKMCAWHRLVDDGEEEKL